MSAKQHPRFRSSKQNIEDKLTSSESSNPFSDPFKKAETTRSRSRLEDNGINGPEFSSFIWNLVNEQEKNEGGSNSQVNLQLLLFLLSRNMLPFVKQV